MPFTKATKRQARLKMGIFGPSGSGKTWTALALASGLGKKIAVVDTEHGSASLYADLWSFDVLELNEYDPQKLIGVLDEAVKAGHDVIVLDSLSHFWTGKGGFLEQVDRITTRSKSGNAFTTGWREMSPVHNRMIDALLAAPIHVIGTARTKTEWVLEDGPKGKIPRKIGMAPVLRDGMEYEFTICGEMDWENNLTITKTRFSAWAGKVFPKPTTALATELLTWLGSGDPVVAPPSAPAVPPPSETKVAPWTTDEAAPAVPPTPKPPTAADLRAQARERFTALGARGNGELRAVLTAAGIAENERLSQKPPEALSRFIAEADKVLSPAG